MEEKDYKLATVIILVLTAVSIALLVLTSLQYQRIMKQQETIDTLIHETYTYGVEA